MSKRGPASLTSSLLAKKGTAVPTVDRLVRLADPTATPPPASDTPAAKIAASQAHAVAPDGPAAESLADLRHSTVVEGAAPKSDKADRVRVTMRIDPERHYRLRLVAAHLNQSTQDVLCVALDAYLDQLAPAVINRAGVDSVAGEIDQARATMHQLNPIDIAGTTEFVTRPRSTPRDPEV